MTNQRPITPPPELVQQWIDANRTWLRGIALEAAQWGADQELEACCEVLHQHDRAYLLPSQLRDARRRPPSLKEQALADFDWLVGRTLGRPEFDERSERIRRALEQLRND
jgi:hypothetical protein